MNKTVIPTDAINRFRHAATHYARTAKSRASRLQALKDDIAALRKRGVSYRAISELLTQNGIPASDTCVMNFCHRTLKERGRKQRARRRATPNPKHSPAQQTAPIATANSTFPATPTASVPIPTESTPVKTRGPHIAKVELLPPGEEYD